MRSRIEPMKKVARMLRRHRPLILNWFRARGEISAAIVEGFNNKAKTVHQKGVTAFARIDAWKSLCTIHSVSYRSQKLPTDSAEDPKKVVQIDLPVRLRIG